MSDRRKDYEKRAAISNLIYREALRQAREAQIRNEMLDALAEHLTVPAWPFELTDWDSRFLKVQRIAVDG